VRTAAAQPAADTQTTTAAVSIVAQAPANSAPLSNKRYEVVDQSTSWTKAKAEAEKRGGYLAVITSAQEQETIANMVKMTGTKRGYWLGGYCERDRIWKWVNNEPMNYTNWAPGEPNNANGGQQNKMAMMRIPYPPQKIGQWDDENNNVMYGFIIEWD
jgi:hypothetical protein